MLEVVWRVPVWHPFLSGQAWLPKPAVPTTAWPSRTPPTSISATSPQDTESRGESKATQLPPCRAAGVARPRPALPHTWGEKQGVEEDYRGLGSGKRNDRNLNVNYGKEGICRSAESTPVLHPFSRKKGYHRKEATVVSLWQHKWGWLGLSHTGAVTGLCILINHVQPGAGSWFYQ